MTGISDQTVEREAAETLASLVGTAVDDEPAFDAPWQARTFAATVALYADEPHEWNEFQKHFIDRIQSIDTEELIDDVEDVYYREWLVTLEESLVEAGMITLEELENRQTEFEEGDRDESEFVVRYLPHR